MKPIMRFYGAYFRSPCLPRWPAEWPGSSAANRLLEYVKKRAEAEEARGRLAAIVDSSEDGIIGMTLDGVITTWNDGAEQMYGYDAANIVGQNVAKLTPPSIATRSPS